jgi:hypothetical protein
MRYIQVFHVILQQVVDLSVCPFAATKRWLLVGFSFSKSEVESANLVQLLFRNETALGTMGRRYRIQAGDLLICFAPSLIAAQDNSRRVYVRVFICLSVVLPDRCLSTRPFCADQRVCYRKPWQVADRSLVFVIAANLVLSVSLLVLRFVFLARFYAAKVAANIQFNFLQARACSLLDSIIFKNDRMHAVYRSRLRILRE